MNQHTPDTPAPTSVPSTPSPTDAEGTPRVVFSAARIAELLTIPPNTPLTPTAEQQAVIEYPIEGTALVVAGAGSGKTETMANRVVWLVANGLVAPDEVLGLTFTRKAAGELRERIAGRLATFAERLIDARERGLLSEAESARADEVGELLADGLELPDVSTYNAFAAAVLQEFGVAAGVAPGAAIIDEATAWGVARETVIDSRDPALVASKLSIGKLVGHILQLDHAVADNLTSFDRVDQVIEEFRRVEHLPYNEKARESGATGKVYAPVRDALRALEETPLITRLARGYAAEKQRRGLLEFSDQLALATQVIERSAEAVQSIRRRYRTVLLDEVQDTSVGQTRFLSRIFAGSAVMAVGDPHQSIYGWRGASAEGLSSFHQDFGGRGTPAATLSLSTSWRNPVDVLTAANAISAPLAAESAVDVPRLVSRTGAATGSVEWRFPETVHEERRALAEWMRDARIAHMREHGKPPTAAIVFRTRSHMAAFSAALHDVGVPNRIVGLGGLLTTPEVTDVVSMLRCIWYADANSELIRILTGPRFRVGTADLVGLREAARWFGDRDVTQQPLNAEDREADRVLPHPDRSFTLVDALDQLARMKPGRHRAFANVSDVGLERLREAGEMLADLRFGVGGSITELITETVFALRLDIELDANEARETAGTSAAHANIDSFVHLVDQFLTLDGAATLASLLEWIERATEADEVAEHVAAPSPDTVHLITAHGSKGLEWDLVAVPRLVSGEFPGQARSGNGWLRTGEIPDELRGDAGARPELNWRISETQQELKERMAEYAQALKDRHAQEERRLAYVAVTRAASRLLVTGSFWGGQSRPRTPSPFLLELQEAGLLAGLPEESAHETDPSEHDELTLTWPLDPLGARGAAVLTAAANLRDRIEKTGDAGDQDAAIHATVRLLLAERSAQQHHSEVPLPTRITASTFHEFIDDPVQAERVRLRPVPQRPFRRTRVGNRFHEWVERRATTARGTALTLAGFDPEGDELALLANSPEDLGEDAADLQPLIDQFERSRWADRQPIAVEQEVVLPFAGRSLVCKLDAVFENPGDDGTPRYEVVDWKSGRAPATKAERESRFFQLDLYRHAYAQWAGIDPARIDVTLFYVAEGIELCGEHPRDLAELERLWLEAADHRFSAAGE
ncbi:DNA helicase-2/ATP-dependent DNA helicase PcrA [Leucobacter exalbidus]|uniref:DNA 3'-5' helicase n=1 Tax=Leucobacter exalbidus TaxID=662960 RepID=A0A940PNS3_9MICO|nr:ATP-dependent DNA helicase [Leucobacter exalbidus]MBP1324814.1 DNA helicase-2/ATP-dependent DNA helicase PcrA [Leucobacter exalbidus]